MNSEPLSFAEQCYALLREVPPGRITTYRDIAHALGTRAYRAVGNAMNKNPYAPDVPCHRVVKCDGGLGGFAYGTKEKVKLLKKEGIRVREGQIVNFNSLLYHF